MNIQRLLFPICLLLLNGCATKYACKLSEGYKCKSLSEVYALDDQGAPSETAGTDNSNEKPSALEATEPVAAEEGNPIFQPPRRLRIWFADWSNGDIYVPNHYIYLRIDKGRWLLPEFDWKPPYQESLNVR